MAYPTFCLHPTPTAHAHAERHPVRPGSISDLDTALRIISNATVELYELFHAMYATLMVSHKYPIVGK